MSPKHIIGILTLVVTLLGCNGDHPSSGTTGDGTPGQGTTTVPTNILTVMTQNVDDGTDFGPIFGALTLATLTTVVADTYSEVQASNIPERAATLAGEIAATQPDVVGLQEASLWRTGPSGGPATTVTFDALQFAQALELLQGPLHTTTPVVIAGDFNVNAASHDLAETVAYQSFLEAGFAEAWPTLVPNDPGFTWPLHGEDPFTPATTPFQRIDLVLFQGALTARGIDRIGETAADRTPSGLWPSDHAGVVASFHVGL